MHISLPATIFRLLRICALTGIALAGGSPARAAVTAKDIQIAGRVITFISPPLTGIVRLGIVYEPGNSVSAADERSLIAIIGTGLRIDGIDLIAVPVPMANLSSAQVGAYFLTANLGDAAIKVGAQATAQKRLCITMDLAATQAGSCTVAVQSDPVQITVNTATAGRGGIAFVTAFLLMVTDI